MAGLALLTEPALVFAQIPAACKLGQTVADDAGNSGVIFGGRGELCLIKYKDGTTQSWVPARQLTADTPTAEGTTVVTPSVPTVGSAGVVIFRPQTINRLVYHADALGHVVMAARVNGAPVQFLVDTGATLVSLTAEDANVAGLKGSDLTFDQIVHTGNGSVQAAFATLREIRIDQLEVDNVPVAVIDSLKQSVLGMSFLRRLKGFEMQDGVFTMVW